MANFIQVGGRILNVDLICYVGRFERDGIGPDGAEKVEVVFVTMANEGGIYPGGNRALTYTGRYEFPGDEGRALWSYLAGSSVKII